MLVSEQNVKIYKFGFQRQGFHLFLALFLLGLANHPGPLLLRAVRLGPGVEGALQQCRLVSETFLKIKLV